MVYVIVYIDFVMVGLVQFVVIYLEIGCIEIVCVIVIMDDIFDFEIKEMLENLMNVDGKEVDVNDVFFILMSQCGVLVVLVIKNNVVEVVYECMIY